MEAEPQKRPSFIEIENVLSAMLAQEIGTADARSAGPVEPTAAAAAAAQHADLADAGELQDETAL